MELSAVIEALRAVNFVPELKNAPVRVRSDSKCVVDPFNQGWLANWQRNGWSNSKKQPVPNRELWEDPSRRSRDTTSNTSGSGKCHYGKATTQLFLSV